MPKVNLLTKTVTIPLFIGSIFGFYLLLDGQVTWYVPIIFYILFGIINGTIAHRYFVHNSFYVPYKIRQIFAFLVVFGCYGPPLFWIIQHRHHHVNSDTDKDVHSPKFGFWQSFILWQITLDNLTKYAPSEQIKKIYKEPIIRFTTKHYLKILWFWLILLCLIDYKLFFAGYCVGILLEFIKLGLVNTVCHMPNVLGNYTNYDTRDQSQNNVLLGIFGLGFGWHNNHHKNSNQLILTKRWWELDIEGYIGWIISRFCKIFVH